MILEKKDEETSAEQETPPSTSDSSTSKSSSKKKKSYVPTPTLRAKKAKTNEILGQIKETVASLKTLTSENSSSQILDFLREESRRRSERDNAFFSMMATF